MTTTGCSLHVSNPDGNCEVCTLKRENEELKKELKREKDEAKKKLEAVTEQLQQLTIAKVGMRHCWFSVSTVSKDPTRRAEFREYLLEAPYSGAFVAQDFYIAFVKAARRMTMTPHEGGAKSTQWPCDSAWDSAIQKVTHYGESFGRAGGQFFVPNRK